MFRDPTRNLINQKITPEQAIEVKAAFDEGVAMCFIANKEKSSGSRISMVSKILKLYPDVLFAKCDCVLFGSESEVLRDAILLVKKSTDVKSFNEMVDGIVLPCGIVKEAVIIGKTDERGIKRAIRCELESDKPCVVKRANLLVDGKKLLLTVRSNVVKKKETESDESDEKD